MLLALYGVRSLWKLRLLHIDWLIWSTWIELLSVFKLLLLLWIDDEDEALVIDAPAVVACCWS